MATDFLSWTDYDGDTDFNLIFSIERAPSSGIKSDCQFKWNDDGWTDIAQQTAPTIYTVKSN
jgi:hypothetical protein